MNVETVAEAAQFPEKEYINGIAVAVYTLQVLVSLILGSELISFEDESRYVLGCKDTIPKIRNKHSMSLGILLT